MEVLALTILVSLILAVIFLVCFTCEVIKPRKNSLEHTSLLPLDDEPASPKNLAKETPLSNQP